MVIESSKLNSTASKEVCFCTKNGTFWKPHSIPIMVDIDTSILVE